MSGGYLAQMPDDPYAAGRPFGYRVSPGEELIGPYRPGGQNRPPERQKESVSAGQVIIWSVGQDRIDQGGKVPPGGPRAEDLVYIVPNPAPQK